MAAKYWNMMPWEFRALSPDHKAELVAGYIVEKEMDGYYKSESAKKMDRVRTDSEAKRKIRSKRR